VDNQEQRDSIDIDLIELWLIFRRYLRLFVGVFVAIFVLGIAITALVPAKYNYSIAVNIGAIRNSITGKLDPILPPDAETDALKNAIIPAVQQKYVNKYPDANLNQSNIEVNTSKDGGLVTLSVLGAASQDSIMRGLLSAVVDKMVQEQDGIIQTRIANSKALLSNEINTINAQLAVMEKNHQQLMAHGNQTDKAFTLLLLDNKMATLQTNLFTLQQQLNVDLPNDTNHTQAISPPQRSLKPTGMGKVALAGMALIMAFVLGLFAVFLAHLKDAARRRGTRAE
jgi:uncharacterized protein involved in exopolysaccharide biosynthesis